MEATALIPSAEFSEAARPVLAVLASIGEGDLREKVFAVEDELLKLPQAAHSHVHRFAGGVYAREITMPAGALLTSAIHTIEHFYVVTKGRCSVLTEDGVQHITAPYTGVTRPGTKRVIFIHEECVWTTFQRTDLTTVEACEATLVHNDRTQKIELSADDFRRLTGAAASLAEDRADYARFLVEYGFTQEVIEHLMAAMQHLEVPMPAGHDTLEMRASPIHGRGMFAVKSVSAGDVLAPVIVQGHRAPPARYTNHSAHPNARFSLQPDGEVLMVALRDIAPDEEVTIDYRQAGREQGHVPLKERVTP